MAVTQEQEYLAYGEELGAMIKELIKELMKENPSEFVGAYAKFLKRVTEMKDRLSPKVRKLVHRFENRMLLSEENDAEVKLLFIGMIRGEITAENDFLFLNEELN